MSGKKPDKKVCIISDKKFLKFFDIEYEEGKHYFAVTRRDVEKSFAVLSEKEAKLSLPDAVTIVLIIKNAKGESYLYLNYEYRYAAGRFLLSPPAGLIDKNERISCENELKTLASDSLSEIESIKRYEDLVRKTLIGASVREIKEETGYDAKDAEFTVLSDVMFSTPGMTDESNALIKCVITVNDEKNHGLNAPDGTELFGGYELLSKEDARKVIKDGRDRYGNFYSIYTYCALQEFFNE